MHHEIDKLRDEVTRLPTTTEQERAHRLEVYREIFYMARDNGYYNRKVEVYPFAFGNRAISTENYESCLAGAFRNRDLASFVACKKALNQGVNLEEAKAFRQGYLSDFQIVCELGLLIRKHIPTDRLSPAEWLLINLPKSH